MYIEILFIVLRLICWWNERSRGE